MSEPTARYIIVFQTNLENPLEKTPIAFVYFQFTLEATIEEDENGDDVMMEVVYCYEIQVHPNYHGYGIGSYLMNVLVRLGKSYHMKRVMLTVFKENKSALKFYMNRLGYKVDEISPSMMLSREEAETYGYEILSKDII
ncbi:hypothetical protein BKA69DRAFT_1029504 [Paraphysoderma sedebokerense]|nr:hypothetical protein BKA69DRAFT_1029504 [Paraphysoderma sedebokerense]